MTASGARQLFYAAAALTGLLLTWFFDLRYSGPPGYVAAWFTNDATSSIAVDLIIIAVVASVFMVTESRRIHMRQGRAGRASRGGSTIL